MDSVNPATEAPNELYALLPPDLVKALRRCERTIRNKPGVCIIRCGQPPDHLVMIESGSVEISLTSEGKAIALATAGAGKVFGLRALLSGEPPEIDVICLTQCRCSLIPQQDFLRIVKTEPQFYFAAAKILSADLQVAQEYLKSTGRGSIRQRRERMANAH